MVILLAAKLAVDSFSTTRNLQSLDNVVILSTKIGALVHETQKERGMTSGFLGSKGEKFKTELPSQRNSVDDKLSDFKDFLKSFDKTDYSAELVENLDSGVKKLDELSSIRNGVSNLSINATVAIGYYTEVNRVLLNVLGSIIKQSNSAQVTRELSSYMSFFTF